MYDSDTLPLLLSNLQLLLCGFASVGVRHANNLARKTRIHQNIAAPKESKKQRRMAKKGGYQSRIKGKQIRHSRNPKQLELEQGYLGDDYHDEDDALERYADNETVSA